jgi:hypothetical protein
MTERIPDTLYYDARRLSCTRSRALLSASVLVGFSLYASLAPVLPTWHRNDVDFAGARHSDQVALAARPAENYY